MSQVHTLSSYKSKHADTCPNIVQGGAIGGKHPPIRVENLIGFAQVPLGIAGPLTIHGENQKGTFHAPLATVEATLVASCSRGCKAFEKSGGIHAATLQEGMSRAPVFWFDSVGDAVSFYRRVPSLESELREYAERTSRFAKLQSITPHIIGKTVHVKFFYTCGDASGQNMTTIATHTACQVLLRSRATELKIVDFHIEGQLASDKKLAFVHIHEPRGVQVIVWGTLTDAVCRSVLHASAERIYTGMVTAQQGSTRAGMLGNNVNTANIFAAMFIACGQDAASLGECGWTQLTPSFDAKKNELTISLFVPSLAVGTVGGGTVYPTQKEALNMIGCAGEGKKWALAETIAAFALALDMSTAGAVVDDTFARSHERLARSSVNINSL